MVSGRLRTTAPSDEELEKLGEDLLVWAAEKKKGELRCRWCEWYSRKHFFIRKEWKRMIDTPIFRPYYEAAQTYLAEKWIDGTINASIAHRYLRLYEPELRESEDADAEAEAARKADALKGQARADEEERQRVIDEIQRNKPELK